MKFKFTFFLPFLVLLAAACSQPSVTPTPVIVPSGTFVGTFYRLRANVKTSSYDTLQTPITIVFDPATGYKVTSDTTIHSGSHGGYSIDANGIYFNDATYTGTTLPVKPHLVGAYQYAYSGSNLQMQQTYADTLGFFYTLTKQ